MDKRKKVSVVIHPRAPGGAVDAGVDGEERVKYLDSDHFEGGIPWDVNDPGIGHALLLEDGREVVNPVPVAPPVGYVKEPTVMEMIDAQVKRHLASLRGDEELDSEEDAVDFDVGDDYEPFSPYEILMSDEFPGLPPVAEGATGATGDAGPGPGVTGSTGATS